MIKYGVGSIEGWRFLLYLGAILLAVAAVGITVLYRPIPRPELNEKPYLRRVMGLDWVGTVLFSCGMVPFLMGILWGGNTYPWSSAAVIASLVIGFAFFVIFGLHQAFIRKDGVFNHRECDRLRLVLATSADLSAGLFKNRNFPIALVTIFVEGIVYITLNTFLGVQVSALYETDPILVGCHFAVLLVCAGIAASVAGYYSHRTKEMRLPLLVGYFCFICACIGFSQVTADQR